MQVETFEVSEMEDTKVEDVESCQALIQELGLNAQEKFYQKTDAGVSEIFPYRKLTAQERVVYKQLCPNETNIDSYGEGVIPLRILQVASFAKEHGPGVGRVVIWHPSNADVKDPVLMWKEEIKSYEFNYFLLARWGEVLDNFITLTAEAKKRWTDKTKHELEKTMAEAQAALATLDSKFEHGYSIGSLSSVSFYFH